MMLFHPVEEDEEYYSEYDIGFSVTFIDDTILKNMEGLEHIPLFIDGSKFYQMNKENGSGFKRFEIDDDYVHLVYDAIELPEINLMLEFKAHALVLGFDADTINFGILSDFENDIDLYDAFIQFRNENKPVPRTIESKLSIPIIKEDNPILKLSNELITKLKNTKRDLVQEKELSAEVLDRILAAEKPVVMGFEFGGNIGTYKIRLMKSLFKTATAKSPVDLKVVPCDDGIFYNIISVKNKNFYTCNVYRVINYES